MTPNDIDVLLHCHCCRAVHPRNHASAVQDSISWMRREGLIEQQDHEWYVTTARGKAHAQQLCGLELPTEQWVGANGEIINVE